ncbi:MAG TPA: hypothetical protein VGP19_16610 [Candidatus Acidoferrales bacterium]|jgi:hypothetical protein|nr:hypothetical protein [Candidatus Acidoferrales bacterium]
MGIVTFARFALARAALPRPLETHGIPQGYPPKSAAAASASTTNRMGDHYLLLVNTAIASKWTSQKWRSSIVRPMTG